MADIKIEKKTRIVIVISEEEGKEWGAYLRKMDDLFETAPGSLASLAEEL